MTKRTHWDKSEKRKQSQKKIQKKLEKILVDYEMEYADTPFYQNTSNCILEGAIDELKSIDVEKIDYGGEGCYFGGRIEALKKLKHDCIFGNKNECNPPVMNLQNCSNCKYHSYDWFDNTGEEFEVCQKENDTINGICEDWEGIE